MLNSNRVDTFNISSRLMTQNYESGPLSPGQISAPISTQRGKNQRISLFKKIMMGKRDISKFESLPKYLQVLINDSTDNFNNSTLARLGSIKGIDINTSYILSPDSKYLVLWNVIFMIILIENLFYLPYKMSVDIIGSEDQKNTGFWFYVMLPFVSYLFDIILTCNTAFYQKGKIYEDRCTILTNYVKRYFFLDLFLTIAQIISITVYPVFDAFVTLRFVKLNEIVQRLQMRLGLNEKYQIFIVVKLVLNLIYVVHYCACAFLFIGVQEQEANQIQWIDKFGFSTSSPIELYVTALYWSSITLLTVGYGDITPQSSVERIFCIFVTMVTIGIVGYVINSISQILKNMNDKVEKRNTKMAKIEVFLQRNNIQKDLSMRIKNYYEHWFSSQFQEDTDDKRLTKHLALPLRRELYTQIYHAELKKSFYINKYVSKECITELCQQVKLARYLPGEQIFTKNEAIKNLMILKTGSITICNITQGIHDQSRTDTSIKLLTDVLVEENFLFQKKSTFDAKAKGLCVIQYLDYDDFLSVLRNFPNDYEHFMYFRDRFQFKKEFLQLRQCEICSENHAFENCYQIFVDKNNEKAIMRHIKQEQQDRTPNFARVVARKKFLTTDIQVSVLGRLLDDQNFDPILLNNKYLQKLGLHEKELKCDDNSETVANTEQLMPSQDNLKEEVLSQKFIVFSDSERDHDFTADKDSIEHFAKVPIKKKFGRFKDLVLSKQQTLRISNLPIKRLQGLQTGLNQEIPASIHENPVSEDKNKRKNDQQRVNKKNSEIDEYIPTEQSNKSEVGSNKKRRATLSKEPQEKCGAQVSGDILKIKQQLSGQEDVQKTHYECIPDFEMMRDYKIFYPKFNLKRVITKVNKNIVGTVNQTQKEELLKKYNNRVNSSKVRTAMSGKMQED